MPLASKISLLPLRKKSTASKPVPDKGQHISAGGSAEVTLSQYQYAEQIDYRGIFEQASHKLRLLAERKERAKAEQSALERQQTVSKDSVRALQDLIREKYGLDRSIWSERNVLEADRPIILEDCRQAVEISQRIHDTVRGWEEHMFEPKNGRYEIPPEQEVKEGRYNYYQCPLPQMPPIDRRTFFHYFWDHASHAPTNDMTFHDRLPKELGCSILMASSSTTLTMGWDVHIIEGPNWPMFPWIVAALLAVTLVVCAVYDAVTQGRESGFTIGQLIFSILMAVLSSIISYVVDTV